MDKDDVMKLKNDITILMSKNAAQTQTIERLADALEFALALSDASGLDDSEWKKYATKRWQIWSMLDIQKAESAARALLAEVRGTK